MAFWGAWKPYVSVAQRRAKAQREMDKLRKKGQVIQPVTIEGRTIARSFWGKGWCDHLESFSDYINRLPRGRTYVRNGSVCHLDIQPGRIEAHVSGSALYRITIRIAELPSATWRTIKAQCAGHIGSMLELLQGKLSDHVMAIVTHRQQGLFPQPGEMRLECSCPDWAVMCKHVAAVLYGVGNRLDSQPELLFLLRGVEAQALITTALTLPDTTAASDSLADDQLGAIFGIDLDIEGDTRPAPSDQSPARPPAHPRARIAATRTRQTTAPQATPRVTRQTKTPQAVPPAPRHQTVPQPPTRRAAPPTRTGTRRTIPPQSAVLPAMAKTATEPLPAFHPTGTLVARLRRQQGLSVAQFAAQLGLSEATVYRWEATKGPLTLQARKLPALAALQQQAKQSKRDARPSRPSKGPRKA